jgi:hypothetical protein
VRRCAVALAPLHADQSLDPALNSATPTPPCMWNNAPSSRASRWQRREDATCSKPMPPLDRMLTDSSNCAVNSTEAAAEDWLQLYSRTRPRARSALLMSLTTLVDEMRSWRRSLWTRYRTKSSLSPSG